MKTLKAIASFLVTVAYVCAVMQGSTVIKNKGR